MRTCKCGLLVGLLFLGVGLGGWGAAGQKTKQKTKPQGTLETFSPSGEPVEFHKGKLTGFAVWHSKRGWHLRTTTQKTKHHFKGHIHVVGGHIEHVHSYHLEKSGKLEDHWKLHEKRHELTFSFHTDKEVDGIDFRLTKSAKEIRFQLHFNGKEQREHIWIGHKGHHPHHDPFTFAAHGHTK